jgi:hypothetical protein
VNCIASSISLHFIAYGKIEKQLQQRSMTIAYSTNQLQENNQSLSLRPVPYNDEDTLEFKWTDPGCLRRLAL